MKKTMLGLMAVSALVGSVYANDVAKATETAKATHQAVTQAAKMETMEIGLNGVTASNRMKIENAARALGAKHPSLSVPTGELKINVPAGKTFDKESFAKKIEEFKVSLK